jgi:hypothetical protein
VKNLSGAAAEMKSGPAGRYGAVRQSAAGAAAAVLLMLPQGVKAQTVNSSGYMPSLDTTTVYVIGNGGNVRKFTNLPAGTSATTEFSVTGASTMAIGKYGGQWGWYLWDWNNRGDAVGIAVTFYAEGASKLLPTRSFRVPRAKPTYATSDLYRYAWSGGEVNQLTGEIYFSGCESTGLGDRIPGRPSQLYGDFTLMIFDPNANGGSGKKVKQCTHVEPESASDRFMLGERVMSDMAIDAEGNVYVIAGGAGLTDNRTKHLVKILVGEDNQPWKYRVIRQITGGKLNNVLYGCAFLNGYYYTAYKNLYRINPMDGSYSDLGGISGVTTAAFDLASAQTAPVIRGRVYNDLDGNGVIEGAELNTGVEGVTVELYDRNGALAGSQVTGESGDYSFLITLNVPNDLQTTYHVRLKQPEINRLPAVQTYASAKPDSLFGTDGYATTAYTSTYDPVADLVTATRVEQTASGPCNGAGLFGTDTSASTLNGAMIFSRVRVRDARKVAIADFGLTAVCDRGDAWNRTSGTDRQASPYSDFLSTAAANGPAQLTRGKYLFLGEEVSGSSQDIVDSSSADTDTFDDGVFLVLAGGDTVALQGGVFESVQETAAGAFAGKTHRILAKTGGPKRRSGYLNAWISRSAAGGDGTVRIAANLQDGGTGDLDGAANDTIVFEYTPPDRPATETPGQQPVFIRVRFTLEQLAGDGYNAPASSEAQRSYGETEDFRAYVHYRSRPPVTVFPPYAVFPCGKCLSEALWTGGSSSVPGHFEFAAAAATCPASGGTYEMLFIPDDRDTWTVERAQVPAAVALPKIAALARPDSVCTGNRLSLTVPGVANAGGSHIHSQGWQLETARGNRNFADFDPLATAVTAADDDGKLLRYCVASNCGYSYSDTLPIRVTGGAVLDFAVPPVYHYHSFGDSLNILLSITNCGGYPVTNTCYLSVYKNSVAPGHHIRLDSLEAPILPGDTLRKTLRLKDLASQMPFDSLFIRINDRGKGAYESQACHTSGRAAGESALKVRMVQADLQTVQRYGTVVIDVLGNDSLPGSLFSSPFSLRDSVRVMPVGGRLSVEGSGPASRLIYTSTGGRQPAAGIDSFMYAVSFRDDRLGLQRTLHAWVYVCVMEEKGGASVCRGEDHTARLRELPAGVTFDWFTADGNTFLATGPERHLAAVGADSVFRVRPDVPAYRRYGGFPPAPLTVFVANPAGMTAMRWTGLMDHDWKNPHNWVAVGLPGFPDGESPVEHIPAGCVDVVIPSDGTPRYPELTDSVACRSIRMDDRAMLKNPHLLSYDSAAVKVVPKPTEKDRFLMWSAPLLGMYSGDYHFRYNYWGDVRMNLFQYDHPDGGGGRAADRFTATFGAPNEPLELGKAFNLRITGTSANRTGAFRFPLHYASYTGSNGQAYATPRSPAGKRFITDGQLLAPSDTTFPLPVNGRHGGNLIQAVNPYLAYLNVRTFLEKNKDVLSENGYLIWDGNINGSFTGVLFDKTGMRYVFSGRPQPFSEANPEWIPPLQSFFVGKRNTAEQVSHLRMSPNWTSTDPAAARTGTLRCAPAESGVLHIRVSQPGTPASACTALFFDPPASPFWVAGEDLRMLFYDELPLALYSLSPLGEPLAVNANGDFFSAETRLGLRAKSGGETRLEFAGLETFEYEVSLVDRLLNKTVDLQQSPAYTFSIDASGRKPVEINDRFSLRMTYGGNHTGSGKAEFPSAWRATFEGGALCIDSEERMDGVWVYHTTGTLIYGSSTPSKRYRISLPAGGANVYMVRVKTGDVYRVEKVTPVK